MFISSIEFRYFLINSYSDSKITSLTGSSTDSRNISNSPIHLLAKGSCFLNTSMNLLLTIITVEPRKSLQSKFKYFSFFYMIDIKALCTPSLAISWFLIIFHSIMKQGIFMILIYVCRLFRSCFISSMDKLSNILPPFI